MVPKACLLGKSSRADPRVHATFLALSLAEIQSESTLEVLSTRMGNMLSSVPESLNALGLLG